MKRRIFAVLLAACVMAGSVLPAAGTLQARAEGETTDVTQGLTGRWSFDGTDRLANEVSGSALAMTKAGNGVELKNGEGVSGGCAYFSKQADSYLKVGSVLNAAQDDFTIAAWVKYDSDAFASGSNVNLFQQTSDISQGAGASGRTILLLNGSKQYSTFLSGKDGWGNTDAVELGRWMHVAVTSDHTSKTMTVYVNGVQAKTNTLPEDNANRVYDGMTDLLVGAHKNPQAASAMKGFVDELCIYDRVVEADVVAALYEEHAVVRELEELQKAIQRAETVSGGSETAASALAQKLEAAREMLAAASASVQEVQDMIGELEAAVRDCQLSAVIHIQVNPAEEKREIADAMFGVNHRFANNAYHTWDVENWKICDSFNEYVKEAGFGSIRYPGGTVANLYDWKKAIGDPEERVATIHGSTYAPVQANFGVDEAMGWIYDDLGSEAIWVYGMGQGNVKDALELFEYLNAEVGEDPDGDGVDWAAVRAANGHPEPYGVTRFEIGNEIGKWGQNYWLTGKTGGSYAQMADAYVNGGEVSFTNQPAVKLDDWRDGAKNGDGTPNQKRYARYHPVIEGSASVTVGGASWAIVDTLEGQGQANVCTFDYETGEIAFGDGTDGNIPASNQAVNVTYRSKQDGFNDYYDALKELAEKMGMEIGVYSCMEETAAVNLHNETGKYDGIVIHPYSETNSNNGGYLKVEDDDPEFYEKMLGRSLQYNITRVQALSDKLLPGKIPVLSEFGVYSHNNQYSRSLGHGIYIANEMIDYIEMGTPYINKHCLVDEPYGADAVGNGSQAVIQVLRPNVTEIDNNNQKVSELSFVPTPSAKVFSVFNNMTGDMQIGLDIPDNAGYYTFTNTNSQKGQVGDFEVQAVKALASKDRDGSLYITVVNNRKDDETAVDIAVDGKNLKGAEIEKWSLTSEDAYDVNTTANPDYVDVEKTRFTNTGENLSCNLAPHSVTAFRIPPEIVIKAASSEGGKAAVSHTSVWTGTEVTFTAEAEEGYDFKGWYRGEELVSVELAYKCIVTEAVELQARFVKKSATVPPENPGTNPGKPEQPERPGQSEVKPPENVSPPAKPPVVKAAAPKSVKAKKTSKGIKLTWKKVKGASGYVIYRSYKKAKGYKKIATIKKGTKKLYLDKKAKKGKVCYYKIKSYVKLGKKTTYSPYSKRVSRKR